VVPFVVMFMVAVMVIFMMAFMVIFMVTAALQNISQLILLAALIQAVLLVPQLTAGGIFRRHCSLALSFPTI
jgi:hypothetical protein